MRFSIMLLLVAGVMAAQQGEALYKKHCATCHEAAGERVPPFAALKAMQVRTIRASLDAGKMRMQGAALSAAERKLVAEYLGMPDSKPVEMAPTAYCKDTGAKLGDPLEGAAWNGWGVNLSNSRFQDAKAAGLRPEDSPRLKLKWAFGLGDGTMARSQPSIAGGRVYVGSLSGTVYSLDAKSGCIYWTYAAEASIRSCVVLGEVHGATPGAPRKFGVYFGDAKANAYGIDAATGKELWRVHLDDHLMALVTGTAQFHDGVVYVPVASFEEGIGGSPKYQCCTFRGSVVALDAANGRQIWKTFTIAEPPRPTKRNKVDVQLFGPSGAGVWATPTVDLKKDLLYAATGDNYSDPPTKTSDAVLALDRKTGRVVWSRQLTENDAFNIGCSSPNKVNCPDSNGPDWDFGQSAILVSLSGGKRALVIGQKSGVAHALDPDDEGRILWQTRVGKGGVLGGIQWGSAADGENMYVALSDLSFARGEPDSKVIGGMRMTPDKTRGGGLFALQLSTGEKIWSTKPAPCPADRQGCSPAQSAAVTAIPGVVFSGSLDGHLRGYSTTRGDVIWDFDTAREFETVNGRKAKGGSLDGPGPVIAGGLLFANSGYGMWGGIPGNVLLAFSVDGQ